MSSFDYVGAVELRGVDVVDAELHGALEHGPGGVAVLGRPEDAGAGELHRAEADTSDGMRAEGNCLVRGHESSLR